MRDKASKALTSCFVLNAIPPFRLDLTVWVLRRRKGNIIDQWDGQYYTRLFVIKGKPIKVTVEQTNPQIPQIKVSTHRAITIETHNYLALQLEKMLGLNCNLQPFYRMADQDKHLKSLSKQFAGLKPPRFPTLFETLANAIACQQVSLNLSIELLNRLCRNVGASLTEKGIITYAFPLEKQLTNCNPMDLKKLGFSLHKSEALIQLAATLLANKALFDVLDNRPNTQIVEMLCDLKGIGRWSAEYALLRGLGRVDIFPGDDVGAQKNLQQVLQLNQKLDYQTVAKLTDKWYPYAGLIYFHLLLHKLAEKGLL